VEFGEKYVSPNVEMKFKQEAVPGKIDVLRRGRQ
jgi:hypothetical protein